MSLKLHRPVTGHGVFNGHGRTLSGRRTFLYFVPTTAPLNKAALQAPVYSEQLEIRRVQWQETIALRHAVLWPNRPPEFCHVEGDEAALHYGAYLHGNLVSVASVYFDGPSARLRKFATAHEFQRRGIGTNMLTRFSSISRTRTSAISGATR